MDTSCDTNTEQRLNEVTEKLKSIMEPKNDGQNDEEQDSLLVYSNDSTVPSINEQSQTFRILYVLINHAHNSYSFDFSN